MIENPYEKEARIQIENKRNLENANQSNWFNRLNYKFQMLIIGLVLWGGFYIYTQTSAVSSFKDIPPTAIIVGLAGVVAAISFMTKQNIAHEKIEKTHTELLTLLSDQLVRIQRMPLCGNAAQIPQGRIKILTENRRSTVEFEPFKKFTSVELIDEENVPRYFVVEQDVYTGNVLSINSTKVPYTAEKTEDFRWVIPSQVRIQKDGDTYLDKK